MKYPQVHDGEWVMPARRKYRMMCCDCGLVHVIDFRLVKKKSGRTYLFLKAARHERATAGARRGKKYHVKRGKSPA